MLPAYRLFALPGQVHGPRIQPPAATLQTVPGRSGRPFSTRCGRSGLLVTVAPHRAGDVEFQPPDGFASPNYRVSLTVTFGTGFDGCAGIYTRASAAGHYENDLCSRDSAGIFAVNAQGAARLAVGFARPAPSYSVVTVSDGADQSLFVNGTKMGAAVSRAFPVTGYIGLGLLDLGGNAGSAAFSHFVFTPLPGSART